MSKITISELSGDMRNVALIDVRKPEARAASGVTIPGASWLHPFDAKNWRSTLNDGSKIVVFCVHGHEVSQAVRGFLVDKGLDAKYLEGGFEAWKDAGNEVVPNHDD